MFDNVAVCVNVHFGSGGRNLGAHFAVDEIHVYFVGESDNNAYRRPTVVFLVKLAHKLFLVECKYAFTLGKTQHVVCGRRIEFALRNDILATVGAEKRNVGFVHAEGDAQHHKQRHDAHNHGNDN